MDEGDGGVDAGGEARVAPADLDRDLALRAGLADPGGLEAVLAEA